MMLSTGNLEVIEFSITPTPNESKHILKLPEMEMLEKLTQSPHHGTPSYDIGDPGHSRYKLPEAHEVSKRDLERMIKLVQKMGPDAQSTVTERPRLDTALTTNTDTESYGDDRTCIIEEDDREGSLSPQSQLQPLEFNGNNARSFMSETDERPPGTLHDEPSRSLFLESECPTLFQSEQDPHRSPKPQHVEHPLSDMEVVRDMATAPGPGHHHPHRAEYASPPEVYPGGGAPGGYVQPSDTPSEEDYAEHSGPHDLEIGRNPRSIGPPPSSTAQGAGTSSTTMPSVSSMPPMGHTVDRRVMERAIGRQLSASTPASILDVLSDSALSSPAGSCLSLAVWHKLVFIMFLLTTCILSTHLLCDEDSAKYKIMAAVIGNVVSAFFCYLFHSLWKSQKLHRVKVITTPIDPYFGALALPTQIEEDQTRPIFSISELVGFRGSSLYLLFLFSSITIASVTSMAVTIRWVELHSAGSGYADPRYPAQVVAIAFALCAPLLRFFDLTGCDEVGGYRVLDIGDLILSALGTFAFGVQSGWSGGSVFLIDATLLFVIMWVAMTRYYSKDLSIALVRVHSEHSTKKGPSSWTAEEALFRKVHVISLRCVVVESLARMCCVVSIFLYIWNLRDVVVAPSEGGAS